MWAIGVHPSVDIFGSVPFALVAIDHSHS